MTTQNDITGDRIRSRTINKNYEENYDRVFNKQKPQEQGDTFWPQLVFFICGLTLGYALAQIFIYWHNLAG